MLDPTSFSTAPKREAFLSSLGLLWSSKVAISHFTERIPARSLPLTLTFPPLVSHPIRQAVRDSNELEKSVVNQRDISSVPAKR
jgi:hypothetical protein